MNDKHINETVNEMLRELVESIIAYAEARHGWSQAELAKRAGMAPAALSRAKTASTFATLEKLARAAGMKVVALPDDSYVQAALGGIQLGKGD